MRLINLLFLLPFSVMAQKVTDTIRVSFTKTVILVFDAPITFDNVGSEDVIAQKKDNKLLLGAAKKGFGETNLHVETESGYYSFILIYKENPKKLFFNYGSEHVIHSEKKKENEEETEETEKPKVDKKSVSTNSKTATPLEKKKSKTNGFDVDCKMIHDKSNSFRSIGEMGNKMFWSLGDIYVKDNYLYFKVSANNMSNIKYDVELVKFVVRSSKGNIKQRAVQEDELTPVYVYNGDKMVIDGKSVISKVFVFEKFTIDDEKKLYIEQWETGGDRKLEFSVTNKEILKVKRLE